MSSGPGLWEKAEERTAIMTDEVRLEAQTIPDELNVCQLKKQIVQKLEHLIVLTVIRLSFRNAGRRKPSRRRRPNASCLSGIRD